MKNKLVIYITILLVFSCPFSSQAKDSKTDKKDELEIPNYVLTITKENTYPNSTEDEITLEPSEFVEEMIKKADVSIDNPDLIKMLNETTIKTSPFALGYRGSIFLGHWPLNYKSNETNVNWEYQKINSNELNNISGDAQKTMSYNQIEKSDIKGALTAKIDRPDQIKKMMLLEAKKNTALPLSFHTVFGKDTKKANTYAVPVKKIGYLNAFAPALSEKGEITFGEVYIELKGSKKKIVVKNVTKQGIGAWIPIQDHVSFSFELK